MNSYFVNITLIAVILSCCLFSMTSEAKKRCRPLLDKLHNVQALQRKGYSLKKGQSLRAREDKARDKWWKCERSSSFTKSKKNKSKKTTAKKNKRKKSQNKKKSYDYSIENKLQSNLRSNKAKNNKNVSAPFASKKVIEVRSKYPRQKRFAWLNYYQRPQRCHNPKDLNTFAFCTEDKLVQQQGFEEIYKE